MPVIQDISVTERSQKVVFQSQLRKNEMLGFLPVKTDWFVVGYTCLYGDIKTKFHLLVILFYK